MKFWTNEVRNANKTQTIKGWCAIKNKERKKKESVGLFCWPIILNEPLLEMKKWPHILLIKMERNNATDTKELLRQNMIEECRLLLLSFQLWQPSLDHSDGCALLLEKVAPRRRSGLPKDQRWRGNEIASIPIPTNLRAHCKIHNCTSAMMWCWRAGTVSSLAQRRLVYALDDCVHFRDRRSVDETFEATDHRNRHLWLDSSRKETPFFLNLLPMEDDWNHFSLMPNQKMMQNWMNTTRTTGQW